MVKVDMTKPGREVQLIHKFLKGGGNENYKAVVDLRMLRHGCTGGLGPNGARPG
jgi:hypothetical protein